MLVRERTKKMESEINRTERRKKTLRKSRKTKSLFFGEKKKNLNETPQCLGGCSESKRGR